jgi:hypothetical protein
MAKKRAAAKQGDDVNKSEAIRQFVSANGPISNKDVIAGLAEQGIEVSSTLVSNTRKAAGLAPPKRRKKRKTAKTAKRATTAKVGRPVGRPAKSSGSGEKVDVKHLMAAIDFAAAVGGVDDARHLVDLVAKIDKK